MEKVVHQHTLSNGLHLIAECCAQNASAALGFFVRTGARDESAPEAGLSHFLEHMMFKGTPTRSTLDISFGLGNLAAQANAYTSEETTVFYSVVLPEYFAEMQDLLSDMLRPSLPQEEFDMEKKVILEEIALYQDRPQFFLFENAISDYFGSHPAGKSVLGTTATVGAVSQPQMKAYFDRRYAPSNMVLVAAGNIAAQAFFSDAEEHCAKWGDFTALREVKPYAPRLSSKEFQKKGINQSHLALITAGPSVQDEQRHELAVLAVILGDSVGSKLYWEIVDKGIAESAVCEVDVKDGTGVVIAYASMEPDRIGDVLERMHKVLAKPLDFSATDLERAKTKFISRMVLGGELPMGRLMALGNEWIYRREIHSLQREIKRIKSITAQGIERALSDYPLKNWCEYRLVPMIN